MEWIKEYWRRWLEWEAVDEPAEAETGDRSGSAELARLTPRELADLPMEFPRFEPRDCRA